MTGLQTNVFPIINLNSLCSDYRLYRIRGLNAEHTEYYQNINSITNKLSYSLMTPLVVLERDDGLYLAVPDNPDLEIPQQLELIRCAVRLEPCGQKLALDYALRTPENDRICLRFLQFLIQGPLYSNKQLWQPSAGRPYFIRDPIWNGSGIEQYRGFTVRAVVTSDDGLGVCIDVANRFVRQEPLPAQMSRDQFSRWKGRHCVYHYGHQWFDVRVDNLSDLNVREQMIPDDGQFVPLLDYIVKHSRKPIPPELAQLPYDSAVIHYRTNRGEDRTAPVHLCYPICDTHSLEGAGAHSRTLLRPHERHQIISGFVRSFLQDIRLGDTGIKIADEPISVERRIFSVPDLEFGHSKVVSVRGTTGADMISLDRLGYERMAALRNNDAGFYVADALERQYLVIPQTVFDSCGQQFAHDLAEKVNTLFPQDDPYNPIIVPYNDRGARNFVTQGNAILDAARVHCTKPGYAVVMIHDTTKHNSRREDQLAAMVTRKLREEHNVPASVIHTAVSQECYELARDKNGNPYYRARSNKQGKLFGYLRNVALNCVLLNNQRWPFALATRLNADVTVGIDVKHNTAGLVVVGGNGTSTRFLTKTSKQKERLLSDQLKVYLSDILRKEAQSCNNRIRTIVIHRDGRAFQSEITGACVAVELLKREGAVAPDASLTVIEIAKSAIAPMRIFDTAEDHGRLWIDNPQLGSYYLSGSDEAFICTTGRPFKHPGTVHPLHIKRVSGALPIEHCLEDVFYLSQLTWTRPDDCSRLPVTIKLNDRFLGEWATEFDEDALEFTLHEDTERVAV